MILIRDAQVVDGTGAPPKEADVLVSGTRIAAVGKFRNYRAETIIDGRDGYVLPGFIDINNDSDHYLTLFTNPLQHDFLVQGVTTVIGGHCGSSLAPLLYGTLESIRKWTDPDQINVGWHTVREFLTAITRRRLGVNFGTLVGHATIRRALIGEELRDLTVNEMKVFERTLDSALREGAFGFSTGLGYAHARQVPYAEIHALAKITAGRGIYTTHLRDEHEGIIKSINETIRLARETGVSTLVSHFRPLLGYEQEFNAALTLLDKENPDTSIRFDSYPSDMSMHTIYTLLPEWCRRGNLELILSHLKNVHMRERLLKEIPLFQGRDLIVVHAPHASYLVGKSIGSFSENHGLDSQNALFTLMRVTKLRAVVLVRNVNIDAAIQSLCHARAFVASNAPSFLPEAHVVRHERMIDVFPKFLRIVLNAKFLSFEKAVQKITSDAAQFLGLKNRGEVREGMAADLVLWRSDRVETVIVNGEIAIRDGIPTGARAGTTLLNA